MDPRGQRGRKVFGAALQAVIGAALFSSLCSGTRGRLTVLLWNPPADLNGSSADCSSVLGVPGCHVTTDRARYSLAHAVVVEHREASGGRQKLPPEPRPLRQRWVWFSLGPPTLHPVPPFMDGLFNMTMSYRSDSDIFAPYGWLEAVRPPHGVAVPPKSRLAARVGGAWEAASERGAYYEELRRVLPVDVHGGSHTQGQLNQLLSRYKFCLAFEDAPDADYITQALWGALVAGAVPVVLGPPRGNYERFLPPEAFIHVGDFRDASALAAFLQELAGDPEQYQRFFQWRSRLRPVSTEPSAHRFCQVCTALWESPPWYQTVPELTRWFK